MKKIYLLGVAAALLMTAACNKSEVVSVGSEECTVTLSAQLPEGISTKATSDGTTATQLSYAVYEVSESESGETTSTHLKDLDGSTTISLKTTVELKLVTGKTYNVIFWAQAEGAPYTVDFDKQTVTVDYTGATANDEKRDAFYETETIEVTGPLSRTIYLYRPFAQVNVATDDVKEAAAANLTVKKTSLKVSNVYNTLDLATGEVSGETEVTYALAEVPSTPSTITVANTKYTWLEFNYLLVSDEKETVDCEVVINDGEKDINTLNVTNVPVQRNYRTNIYGSLLTSKVIYNVEIDPEFAEPDYDHHVTTEEELVAALERGGSITVDANIVASTAINVAVASSIDLNDHTVSTPYVWATENLTISNGTLDLNSYSVYQNKESGSLTLDDVTLTVGDGFEGSTAVDCSGGNSTVTITNCTINANEGETTCGVAMYGDNNTVTIENTTINSDYFAFTVNGSGLTKGATITIKNSNLSAKYAAMYVSANANSSKHIIAVEGSTLTSEVESAIEVKKTELTVTSSTLVSKATAQSYAVKTNGSAGEGYGVVLAGYATGTAYEGSFTESNNTYTLAAGDNAVKVGIYNGTNLVDYSTYNQ